MERTTKKIYARDESPEFFKPFIPEHSSTRLRIPSAFVKNFVGGFPDKVILECPTDYSCCVQMRNENGQIYFQEGWQKFVQDQSLQDGDMLVFSNVHRPKFHVTVYERYTRTKRAADVGNIDSSAVSDRWNQVNKPSNRSMATKENDGALQAANGSLTLCPSFRITLGAVYIERGFLSIPAKFHNFFNNKRPHATLEFSQKSWSISLKGSGHKLHLSKGWGRFVKDNNLQAGDVCSFELIDRIDNVMKVTNSRLQANPKVECRGSPKVSSFDDYPEFFRIYFPDRSSEQVCMETTFMKHFNGSIPHVVILKDLGGNCWHVGMAEADNQVLMKNGWRRFVSDHSLQKDDFLFFRYDEPSSFTFRIFGANGCKREVPLRTENRSIEIKEETPEVFCNGTCTGKRKGKDTEEERTGPKRSHISNQKHSYVENEEDRNRSHPSDTRKQKPSKLGATEDSGHKSPGLGSKLPVHHKVFQATEFAHRKTPHFITTLTLARRSHLNIPQQLVTELHIRGFKEMMLCNKNGKKWPVKILETSDRLLFARGWLDFLRDNKLCVGDKCLLDFVVVRGKVSNEINIQLQRIGKKERM